MAQLLGRLLDLEARLVEDSTTSSQPPSKDKPWVPKSERQKTGWSSGAQRGHIGKTLKMAEHVDKVVSLPLTGHCACGHAWESVNAQGQVARQVHDLPELRLQVTEYRADVKV